MRESGSSVLSGIGRAIVAAVPIVALAALGREPAALDRGCARAAAPPGSGAVARPRGRA